VGVLDGHNLSACNCFGLDEKPTNQLAASNQADRVLLIKPEGVQEDGVHSKGASTRGRKKSKLNPGEETDSVYVFIFMGLCI
jgi:hypothetical protein